jgi:hypothetical protein
MPSDHEHGHGHDHDDGQAGLDPTHVHDEELGDLGPPRFVDLVQWLVDESRLALAEEGVHASVVFLGMPDGTVRAQRFDATGQHDVAAAWGRVATWAKGVGANAVYFVAEAKRGHGDDEHAEPELEEDVLVLSALSAEGEEATFETPFERDDEGSVTLGETESSDVVAVTFNEFRELWGLPLLEPDADAEPEPDHDGA